MTDLHCTSIEQRVKTCSDLKTRGECELQMTVVLLAGLGPHYWYMLHNMSLNYQMNPTRVARQKMRAFVEVLPYLLPCRNCSEHAKEFMASADLDKALTNRKTLFTFMWNFHNHVNKRLGKPEMSFNDALQMYKSK